MTVSNSGQEGKKPNRLALTLFSKWRWIEYHQMKLMVKSKKFLKMSINCIKWLNMSTSGVTRLDWSKMAKKPEKYQII